MNESRQVSRAAARRAAKLKKKSEKPSLKQLEQQCMTMIQIIGDLQVSLNAMLNLIVEKKFVTLEEFQVKRDEVLQSLRQVDPAAEPAKEIADAEIQG